ncbi:MAG: hypothetical protein HY720_30235 [Planctomycetes bacterium]|nr:hypothetical protein [Planctomycetota bacterium]
MKGLRSWARKALQTYPFPGNVRELANLLRQAVLFSRDDEIWLEDLPAEVRESWQGTGAGKAASYAEVEKMKDELEREFLIRVLSEARGNVSEAARRAGTHRVQLHRLARRHGLDTERFRPPAGGSRGPAAGM